MVNSSIQHSNSQPFATCFPSHFIQKTAVPLRYKWNSSFPKNCISKIMYTLLLYKSMVGNLSFETSHPTHLLAILILGEKTPEYKTVT